MRALGFAIVTLLALLIGIAPASAQTQSITGPVHLAMTLVPETATPRADTSVTVALDTRPDPEWHGYWRNPGDAGFPSKLEWTLPSGVTAGEAEWPVPTTLLIAGLMNYVYEAPYAPLVTLKIPAGLAAGTKLPIKLHATYLVCTREICVPEDQTLSTELTVGDGAVSAAAQASIGGWRRAIPRPLDAQASYAASGDGIRIAVPYPAGASLANAYFFPVTTGAIDYAAPQTVTRDGDRVLIATKGKAAGPIEGVLRIGDGQGLAVKAAPGAIGASETAGGAAASTGMDWSAALLAFAGAVLGGLILNIMPCVFPILSLKALSLARSGADERGARHEALAYTGGVVLVCLALGGAILALRAGGSAVGWAFQLQDPRAIVVLLLLSVAISLNLTGLFEMPMPRFAGTSGATGAFATGALAAFVATPCTGPFMGAALGAALVLPWYAALAIFAGLGLGLALPFLAIGFVPALRKRLPKPGAWMERFRHALSVPMWLTAIALAWVLGQEAGVNGMTLGLLASLAVGLVLWIGGRRQAKGLALGWVVPVLLLGIVVATGATIARAPKTAVATAGSDSFSEAKLASLRAENKPVFVYFTADWCLTCKVNEKAAIDTDATRAAFAKNKVAVLVGDWTDGDPVLGRFIQAHNRAGVPLYLYYAPGAAEPQVLPQVLTSGLLAGLGA